MPARRLSRSEKSLLIVCGIMVFSIGNLIFWKEFLSRSASVRSKLGLYEGKADAAVTAVADVEFWQARQAWLDQMMPAMGDPGKAHSELLEFIQRTGAERGLQVTNHSLEKPENLPHYRELAVSVSLSGPDQALFRWLVELQSPEKFYFIKYLRLASESEGATPRMSCRLTLARWFK